MKTINTHIIMPVKDSMDTAEKAIRAIVGSGYGMTVYNDYSTEENTQRLHELAQETGIKVVDIAQATSHPSPNYRYVLIEARKEALAKQAALVIVESDVIVGKDTIQQLCEKGEAGVGMVACVTTDSDGNVNFPYEYAKDWLEKGTVSTKKRLSFCCTLLMPELLSKMDWEKELNPEKNWYDVAISHRSIELGFSNLLMMENRVLHLPHSSRPWKQLKYTNPLRYYWRKLTQGLDKI